MRINQFKMRLKMQLLAGVASGFWVFGAWAQDFLEHPKAQEFMDEMVAEHEFDRAQLEQWFAQVERKDSVLKAISRPAERVKSWKEYRKIFLTDKRIDRGVDFWSDNREALAKASDEFGVPEEIIVAIIGVETHYGRITGGFRVFDSLATLAFEYPKRATFFRKELVEFLLLAREQGKSPLELKGSYAGAMGYGQFMPSSYRAYAYDYNGDGFIDIWDNTTDAIGSVANYFVRHGWRSGQPVAVRARVQSGFDGALLEDGLKPERKLSDLALSGFSPAVTQTLPDPVRVFKLEGERGAEFWLGMHNFYVITRYNRSTMYALAVYQLAEALAENYRQQELAATSK